MKRANELRRLEGVLYTGRVANLREVDPSEIVVVVLTQEVNGFQEWEGRVDNSIPDERGIDYTPGRWFVDRDDALEQVTNYAQSVRV